MGQSGTAHGTSQRYVVGFAQPTERRSNARPRRGAAARVEPQLSAPRPRPAARDADPRGWEIEAGAGLGPWRDERIGTRREGVPGPFIALLIGLAGIAIACVYPTLREAERRPQTTVVDRAATPQVALPQTRSVPVDQSEQDAIAPSPLPTGDAVAVARDDGVRGDKVEPTEKAATPDVQTHADARPGPSPSGAATARRESARVAGQRVLAAADQALAAGRLTTPSKANAYALYKQVLAIDPGSADAGRGLQTVRQRVVNRALAELAGNRLEDARRSLATAAEVGADPQLIAHLQNEVDYQRRLIVERGQ